MVSLDREPPEVELVEKLTGSLFGGWNSACQPHIESEHSLIHVYKYSRGQKKVSVPYRIINVLRAYLKRTR